MIDYKTVHEVADEWNVSVRHVQYLCKRDKINGAVKKAGTWFIPADVILPIKNTKSNVKDFKYVGTKKKIFSKSIELFMRKGFDATSIKDIADTIGIAQSAVYNHFITKQEILDTIYNYYCHYYIKDRPSIGDIEPILRNGSLMDIMACIRYDFDKEYEQELNSITKIIFQRNSIDERAREITKSLMIDEGIRFVEEVFDKAVEIGRLAPLDAHAMSVFINSVRIMTLHIWIVDPSPETMIEALADEEKLFQYATRLLTDLKKADEIDGGAII